MLRALPTVALLLLAPSSTRGASWHFEARPGGTAEEALRAAADVPDPEARLAALLATAEQHPDTTAAGLEYAGTWRLGDGFAGGVDEVAVYTHEVSAQQAKAHYQARDGKTPPPPPPPPPAGSRFSDVGTGHPFYREITWLADRGVTRGYADGTFRPSAAVNRDAMAAFLYRDAGL